MQIEGPELLLFALSILLVCLFVLTVSGMFPGEFRPQALQNPLGATLLYASIAIVAALTIHLVYFAARHLDWPVAIIAGGLTLLGSPFIHRNLPRMIQDDAAGALGLAAGGLVLHGLLAVIVEI